MRPFILLNKWRYVFNVHRRGLILWPLCQRLLSRFTIAPLCHRRAAFELRAYHYFIQFFWMSCWLANLDSTPLLILPHISFIHRISTLSPSKPKNWAQNSSFGQTRTICWQTNFQLVTFVLKLVQCHFQLKFWVKQRLKYE